MKNENGNAFKGTQENMCEALRLGLNLYNDDLLAFSNMNAKYTKEWGIEREAEIDAALTMPDVNTRRAVPSNKRSKLIPLAQTCTDNWLILSGLIKDVAPPIEVESLLTAAGSANYADALKNNWTKVKALMMAGSTFIENNKELLENGGKGMLPGFPETFANAQSLFEAGMTTFYDAKQDMPAETVTKVDAMNTVYQTMQAMFSDGKIIFKRDKPKRSSYAYTNLLAKVQGAGKDSGYRFTLQQETILTAVTIATVYLIPTGATYPASETGIIEFTTKPGNYEYTITAPGFATASGTITINPSVIGRKKLILKKAAENAAINREIAM